MSSIESLPNECLHKILSYIDKPSCFFDIALTCKTFRQVTRNVRRNVLHTNLLRPTAKCLIECYFVENGDPDNVDDLIYESLQLPIPAAKEMFTYGKVEDAWHKNGPVVAKLLTWVRNQESRREESPPGLMEPRGTFTEYREVMLKLPSCGKSMVIKTRYDDDYDHDSVFNIFVTCRDLRVSSSNCCSPENYMHWNEDDISSVVKPMKQVIELLQEELGETVPPITNRFFIWLCYFFPDNSNLVGENRLSFKDAAKNTKPTHNSFQAVIDEFQKDQRLESKLRKLASERESGGDQKSVLLKMLAETSCALARRSETEFLEGLKEDAGLMFWLTNQDPPPYKRNFCLTYKFYEHH